MRTWSCLLILVLILAAAPALAGPPHACDLLSRAEAASALGQPVAPAKPRGPNPIGQSICFYSAQGGGMKVRYVQISLILPPPKMRKHMPASRLFADARGRTKGAKAVSGLGEGAWWGGSGMKMGAGLHVIKGDYYFTVDVAAGDPAKDLAAAKKLAKLILGRLK